MSIGGTYQHRRYTIANFLNTGDASHYPDTDFVNFYNRCVARKTRIVRVS